MSKIESPGSLHKYTYTHNSPTNGTDPSGHAMLSMVASLNVGGVLRSVSIHTLRRAARRIVNEVIAQVGNVRQIVRRCIREKKNECWDTPVMVVGGDNAAVANHIWEAQIGTNNNLVGAGFFFAYKYRVHSSWYEGQLGCSTVDKYKAQKSGMLDPECDEFPMLKMNRGGSGNHPTFVALRYVPKSQNRSGGGLWKQVVYGSKMHQDPKKRALVIAWDEIPVSFYLVD